ncbi:single-stranded DNA-binding protein [Corynebacterium atypicum]|uniref:single-stranded DNA-binding protein n=1 Tax=Corynebacterium atypicum TaxID=191610 RepID=UPI0006923D6A|nr:single-stranded DNA-binding protein [Corynebacterium atypicum]
MANQPVTLSGNLTGPVHLRRTQTGALVANFRLAADRSVPVEEDGSWRRFDQLYIDVEAWGDLAYNCRASLRKGAPVWAHGFLVTQEWLSKPEDGEESKRLSKIVLKARSVGFELVKYRVASERSTNVAQHFEAMEDPMQRAQGFDNLIDEDRGPRPPLAPPARTEPQAGAREADDRAPSGARAAGTRTAESRTAAERVAARAA